MRLFAKKDKDSERGANDPARNVPLASAIGYSGPKHLDPRDGYGKPLDLGSMGARSYQPRPQFYANKDQSQQSLSNVVGSRPSNIEPQIRAGPARQVRIVELKNLPVAQSATLVREARL